MGRESAPATLLTNLRIFDGESDRLSPPSNIRVEGRQIAAISTDPIEPPTGTRIIDGGGRVATPGFVDTHVHLMLSLPLLKLTNIARHSTRLARPGHAPGPQPRLPQHNLESLQEQGIPTRASSRQSDDFSAAGPLSPAGVCS